MLQTAFGLRLLPDIRKTGWSIFSAAGHSSFWGGISRAFQVSASRSFNSFLAPPVDGGVFRGTAEKVSVEGVFNDFSGIVLVRKNQIGDFKVKRSAVLAFQPAQLEGHGFVGKDQLAGPAVAYF